MEPLVIKIRNQSSDSCTKAYMQITQYYSMLGIEGQQIVAEIQNRVYPMIFSNTAMAWKVLSRYATIQEMTEAEKIDDELPSASELNIVLEDLKKSFSQYEADFGHNPGFGPTPYADILAANVRKFCYFVAATDGILEKGEAEVLNTLLGEDLTWDEAVDKVVEAGVVSEEDRALFKTSVMKSFVIAIFAEKAYKKKGEPREFKRPLFYLLQHAGMRVMASDGDVDEEERLAINAILDGINALISKYDSFN